MNDYSVDMTLEDYKEELFMKNQESRLYRDEVLKLNKEILEQRKLYRDEIGDLKEQYQQNMEEYYAEREMIAKDYLAKKVCNDYLI